MWGTKFGGKLGYFGGELNSYFWSEFAYFKKLKILGVQWGSQYVENGEEIFYGQNFNAV